MLYAFFPELINMSLTASAVIVIVAILRPLLRRVPRSVSFLLWCAVLFRLICPVSFASDYSVFQRAPTMDGRIQVLPTALLNDTLHLQTADPAATAAEILTEAASGSLGRTDFARLALMVCTWVWIAGIVALLIYNLISFIRLYRHCTGSVAVEKRVYLADRIRTPFVLGRRIYLPSDLSPQAQVHILLHERMHLRRLDPLWKLIAFLALMMHWFNPIVWLGFHLFVRDMEIACDERVLRTMDGNARADYAETLLQLSAVHRFPTVSPAFGEDSPKTRIKRIVRYKKPLKLLTAPAAVAVVVVSLLLVANPQVKTGAAGEVIPEFPQFSGELYSYTVNLQAPDAPTGWVYSGGHEEIAPMVYGFLQNLEVEHRPASESRAEDRDAINSMSLSTSGKNKAHAVFNFSHDFSRFWVDNGVKPSYTYTVKNPAAVRELFSFLLTGETKSLILDTAVEANRVAMEEDYITAIYCPAMTQNEGFIQIGELHASYVAAYLCTKLENEYGYAFDLGGFDWDETTPPTGRQPSPESVEFVIRDDLRVQIWKNSRLAVIRTTEDETWYKTPYGDYWEAVTMVKDYSRKTSEMQAEPETELSEEINAHMTPSESPAPSFTPAPTPAALQPWPTPEAAESEAEVSEQTEPAATAVPTMSPTPEPTATPEP